MTETLTFTFKHTEPLELMAVSRALQRIAARYVREARHPEIKDARLVIRSVRDGSLIVDLAPLIAYGAPLLMHAETVNTVVDFAKNLQALVYYFLGRAPEPEGLTTKDCEDVREIFAPIVQSPNNGLIVTAGDGANVVVFNINHTEANAAQNQAAMAKDRLTERSSTAFTSKVFYWQTADRSDEAGTMKSPPDKGVIEDFDEAPRKVHTDPAVKNLLLQEPVFGLYFLVDGETLVAKGKIVGYRITAVLDSGPLP